MINLETFKQDLYEAVDIAEQKDGSGTEVHAKLLEFIFTDMKECWVVPEEALEEILFVLNKVYPTIEVKPLVSLLYAYWSQK